MFVASTLHFVYKLSFYSDTYSGHVLKTKLAVPLNVLKPYWTCILHFKDLTFSWCSYQELLTTNEQLQWESSDFLKDSFQRTSVLDGPGIKQNFLVEEWPFLSQHCIRTVTPSVGLRFSQLTFKCFVTMNICHHPPLLSHWKLSKQNIRSKKVKQELIKCFSQIKSLYSYIIIHKVQTGHTNAWLYR